MNNEFTKLWIFSMLSWNPPTNGGFNTDTFIIVRSLLNDRVSFVNCPVTAQAAVIRHGGVPGIHLVSLVLSSIGASIPKDEKKSTFSLMTPILTQDIDSMR